MITVSKVNSCRYFEQNKTYSLHTFQEQLRAYWKVKLVNLKQTVLRGVLRINEFKTEFQPGADLGNHNVVPRPTQCLCVIVIGCNVVRVVIICR